MSEVFSQLFGAPDTEQVSLDKFPEEGDYVFGVFKNGLFEREKVPGIGCFTTQKQAFSLPTGIVGESVFTFDDTFIPIPIGILDATIRFYRKVMKNISSEVMTMVVYDEEIGQYKIIVPKQTVSGASVRYEQVPFKPTEKYIVSMHSHVNMAAFFSGTDDNDEKRAMFYGVVGRLALPVPEIKLRAKKDRTAFALETVHLFDLTSKFEYDVPELEILNISQGWVSQYPAVVNRTPAGAPRVYDYRPVNSTAKNGYSYYDYEPNGTQQHDYDDLGFFPRRAQSRSVTNMTDLYFIDPEVALALEGFGDVYSQYVEKNLNLELSKEEYEEQYHAMATKLCTLIDALDVEPVFHDLFIEHYYETGGDSVLDEVPEDDDEVIG